MEMPIADILHDVICELIIEIATLYLISESTASFVEKSKL